MLALGLLMVLLMLPSELRAQQVSEIVDLKEEKRNQPKKWQLPAEKPNETVMAAWAPVTVEHYFGLRGGYGIGTASFQPIRNTVGYEGLLNFGMFYRFDVPSQKYVGTIEATLEYAQRGFAYETYNESGEVYSREYSTVMLALPWQPYLPLGKGGSRFYLNAGPYFSYALQSSERTYATDTGETITEGDYEYDILRDNRWEYGVVAGAGLSIKIAKRALFGIDARYHFMLSDVLKNVTKYPENPFRSPVNHLNISATLSVRFGKTAAQKLEEKQAKEQQETTKQK